jgi:hypothetical protein
MDWQFVDDEKWRAVHDALNGAGVESVQAKWEEMFGIKDEGEKLKDEVTAVSPVVKKRAVRKPAVKKEEKSKKKEGKSPPLKGKKTAVKKKVAAKSKPVIKVTKKATPKKKAPIKKSTGKKVTGKSK